jgi:hypothetical protein
MKMRIKGQHTIKYTLEGEKNQIEVRAELKQIDGLAKSQQNVWYAVVILNDRQIDHPDAPYCVNAQYMAEQVADEEIKKLRAEHGRALRVKRK